MKINLKKSSNYLLLVLVIILAIVIIVTTVQKIAGVHQPMIFNYGISYMSSENMGDTIPKGSLMLIQKKANYYIGDIISYSYELEDEVVSVTNRITNIDGQDYHVEGDGSEFLYPYVNPDAIYGKVIFKFPLWILLVLGIGVWTYWISVFIEERKKKQSTITAVEKNTNLKSSENNVVEPTSSPKDVKPVTKVENRVTENIRPRIEPTPMQINKPAKVNPKRVHIDMSYVPPARKAPSNINTSNPEAANFVWQPVASKNANPSVETKEKQSTSNIDKNDVSNLVLSIEARFDKANANRTNR